MVDAWLVSTVVAVIAGVVGFFVVLRGSAFPAHAIPNGAFAGAAAANAVGLDTLVGLAVFAVFAALGIGTLGRRGRRDVATALALVMMLAIGALFLSQTTEYEPQVYALLFGEVLGVGSNELAPVAVLAVVCVVAVAVLWRPLLLSSVVPEIGEARGVRAHHIDIAFLVVLALATAMTVPVVGALLIFSLMIGPPAAARSFTDRPRTAVVLSVGFALVTVWTAIALSYATNWPIGFFVGAFAALDYGIGRVWGSLRRARAVPGPRAGVGGLAPGVATAPFL